MHHATSCPAPESFDRLLRGDLPFAEVEQITRHVEECDRCAAAVQSLKAEDTLVEAMRAAATATDRPEKDVVLALADRLKGLSGPAVASFTEDSGTLPPPGTAAGEETGGADDAEVTGFLAPSQGPGEIGRLGSYRVLRVLGRGGMGVVFQAEDMRLGRTVALKAMLPETAGKAGMKERFLREARAAAAVEHDHIIPIYQVDEDRGVPYISMPFLKGMSLEDWLRKRQTGPRATPLPVAQVVKLGREIARGLAAAHARGLIHRDIKPANIWLDASAGGRVKILDFGLARLTQSAGEQNLTQSGVIMGTPSHMAPEQARGEQVDARADLFSLGVVLYRLCTGGMPFTGKDTISTLMAVVMDDPPAPHTVNPSVPRPLSDLVMKLLAKDPAKRFGSADEVVAALQAVARPAPASAPPAAAAPVAPLAAPAGNPWADLTEPAFPAPPRPKLAPKAAALSAPQRRLPRRLTLVLAAAVLLGLSLGGVVLFWPTAKGTVRIETNAPDVRVSFDKDGPTITGADKAPITLKAGEHGIVVTRGNFTSQTDKFMLKKGETVTLRITFLEGKVQIVKDGEPFAEKTVSSGPRPAPVAKESGDRKAAAWVLSVGGNVTVRVGDTDKEVTAAKDLPTGDFRLTAVNLWGNAHATDGELARLEGLSNLTSLELGQTAVGDAGLVHLRGLTGLAQLSLRATQVTDSGLERLKGLTSLTSLNLDFTHVKGAGLAHLSGLPRLTHLEFWGSSEIAGLGLEYLPGLTELNLDNTSVNDAGLQHLRGLTNLTSLGLAGTRVSDDGLARIAGLTKLSGLGLGGTRVSDAGLVHLKTLTNLSDLNLSGTRVSDAGLIHLKGLTNLRFLYLAGTRVGDDGLRNLVGFPLGRIDLGSSRVSARGFASVRAAFPGAEVLGEPKPSLAEDLVAAGAALTIRPGEGREERLVKKGAELPREPFRVRRADCRGVKKSLPDLLARLGDWREAEFENLQALDLSGCPVENLSFAQPLQSLRELNVSGSRVADLQPLSGLKHLRKLSLDRTPVTGLRPVAGMTGLEELSLVDTPITDPALQALEMLPNLRQLDLSQTRVTGLGLGSLAKVPKLAELSLARSKVSDLFAADVGALTKLERLSLAGCPFGDGGLRHLAGLKSLTQLDLTGTQATADGVATLQKALPRCKIVWEAARGTVPSPKEDR